MKIKRPNAVGNDKGFTIIELLIALSVLSVILVMATVILIQIGKLYSKGVNAAALQNISRNVNSDIASALQFSGSKPFPCTIVTNTTCAASERNYPGTADTKIYSFCIDTTRYSYVLGREKGEDTSVQPTPAVTPHVLWRDTMKNGNSCPALDISVAGTPSDSVSNGDGYDMIPEHMRLTRFKFVENPAESDNYDSEVSMAYGDNDLVNTDSDGRNTCNGGAGSQFCSVSNINTTVKRRIIN